MDEPMIRVLILLVYTSLVFLCGHIAGTYRCRSNYDAILQAVIKVSKKVKETNKGESE